MQGSILFCEIVLAILFLSFQPTTEAQKEQTQEKEQQKDSEFRVVDTFPLVVIEAQVISRITGLPVDDLKRADFVISENNIQQDIHYWDQGDAPVSLLILIDALDAYNNSNALDNQIQALKSSLDTYLRIEDKASIVVISEHPVILQDFTFDKELISNAFDRLNQYKIEPAKSAENRLSHALQQAANLARAAYDPRWRNAIILISNASKATADNMILPENVVRAIIKSRSIFCWDSPAHLPTDFLNQHDPGEIAIEKVSISELVRLTGGEVPGGDWKSFIKRLRVRHMIGYVPIPHDRKGELLRIKLELVPNKKRDRLDPVLIYPQAAVIPSAR